MKKDYKQTGRVNYVWVLAGGYLWYLAFRLVKIAWKGETSNILLTILAVAVFLGVGAGLFLREWKAYEYGKQHIDDPETWSEDAPLEESKPTVDALDSLDEEKEEHHGD